ncbi:MAG: site-specific DNA-methyltransferase [Prevotella sp.]|nr:site-specific DNA-methyltransferase [Prevotella sp.]
MPEIFDEGKIDFEKLKATLGENITFSNERYVLNWAGKSDAFRVMQCPSSATLVPCKEESVDFDTTQNIFIEGENMEVLKVLQKSYFGKVKMIYIDPPYNTGNDSFIYPDKFSETKEEYMKRVGDKDAEGYMTREGMFRKNSRENGQYHSNWLNMMMPRLYLAKSLLREDGVIFISIDDNEVHNLRLLMNEIFGEENFVAQVIWKNKFGSGALTTGFIGVHEYVLVYSKESLTNITRKLTDKEREIYNKTRDSKFATRGGYVTQPLAVTTFGDRPNLRYPIYYNGIEIWPNKQWVWEKKKMMAAIENDEVVFNLQKDGSYNLRSKKYLIDENGNERRGKPTTFYTDVYTQNGTEEIRNLFGALLFDYSKPVELVKFFLSLEVNDQSSKDSIILDFFSGSGTTAQAVMQLNKEDGGNRHFICVQLPELCDPEKEAYKAGYSTIAEISKERIRRAGNKLRAEAEAEKAKKAGELSFDDAEEVTMPDWGFKVFKLSDSNFKQWREIHGSEQEQWKQQTIDFLNPVAENATIDNMVYELLLKNGKSLNSAIHHSNNCYIINDSELILLLESVDQSTIDYVLSLHPEKVIALDNLFSGNDQLKTNTALQLRDAGITFKTI